MYVHFPALSYSYVVNSFSKIMGPGLRLGWIHTSGSLMQRLENSGIVRSGGSLAHFASGVMYSSLKANFQREHLKSLKLALSSRASVMMQTLLQELPDCIDSISKPQGTRIHSTLTYTQVVILSG